MPKKCCIIGAGVAGLTSIKHCLEVGIEPTCFEKDDDIGGLWNYHDEAKDGFPSLYKSCRINTSKEMTCFSDFPIPKEFPNFMHHTDFKRYLDMYAEWFKLRKYIKFKTWVLKVRKAENFETTGQWVVTTRQDGSKTDVQATYDFVLVCNGHYYEPKIPTFPGIKAFKGTIVHTHDYKDYKGFENKRILVIGIGNSAADVACELSHHARHVYISTRRGTYCVQRAAKYGIPFDHLAITRFQQSLPPNLMRPFHFHRINSRYRHQLYGLSPKTTFQSPAVTISDDLPNRILVGTISIRDNISRFTEHGAEFEDGSQVNAIDVIIIATGYTFSFPFLDESILKVDNYVAHLYKQVWPTNLSPSTLAVIGLVQPFGPLPPVLEMQARWATQVFAGKCILPPPDKMMQSVAVLRDYVKEHSVTPLKDSIRIPYVHYIDELAKFIGCRPNLMKMFITDLKLWKRVVFEPATPPQWRLEGTGSWSGARQAIEHVHGNTWFSVTTRKCGDQELLGLYDGWINLFKKLAFVVLAMYLLHCLMRYWFTDI